MTRLTYPRTHELLCSWDHRLSYDEFIWHWSTVSAALEERAGVSHAEYLMLDVVDAFASAAAVMLEPEQAVALELCFAAEWSEPVAAVDGAAEMLARLAVDHRLAVVSNTHSTHLVPDLLERFGLGDSVDEVVLSADVGVRKPNATIYERALAAVGVEANDAVFVGDSLEADYRGPLAAGIGRAFLIDAAGGHSGERSEAVPDGHRLASVLDLEERISPAGPSPEC